MFTIELDLARGHIMLSLNKDAVTQVAFFPDDGIIPNSRRPVVLYRGIVSYSDRRKIEEELKHLVAENRWYVAWPWRIYTFTHWHSTTHEGLICIDGRATIRLGGPRVGCEFEIASGDVLFLPAGVAHRKIASTKDFTVCGIYPKGKEYDLIKGARTLNAEARGRSRTIAFLFNDPLLGKEGSLSKLWK